MNATSQNHPESNTTDVDIDTARRPVDPAAPSLPDTPLRFCLHFSRFYAFGIALVLLFEAGQSACAILLPYAIAEIIDLVNTVKDTAEPIWGALRHPLILLAALNIGIVLFSRASGTALVILAPAMRRRVRHQLFGYLQQHSQRYFMSNFAGSLAKRISEVAMSFAHALWTVVFDFWPLLITAGVSLILLGRVNGELALALAGWLALYTLISYLLALRCRDYARQFAAARSTVSGRIVDSVTNIMNAKLFARRDYERSYLNEYLDMEVEAARRTYWFMEKIRWFQYTAAMVLMLGITGFALKLWSEEGMTAGEFAMAATLSLLLIEKARGLSRQFLEFFEYFGNINDGVNTIVRPHDVRDRQGAVPLAVTRGEIRLEHVDFAYNEEMGIFSDLSLSIEPGQKVGLVGFSGSGKSTLFNLLLRLYEPQRGQILIDGQDISTVTQESLRAAIAMIPQDPMLFHRSLMENIRYGRLDASDEEVRGAARRAHAHEFIAKTAEKYDSLVGERGVRLSGGQRQRIALARAILKDAPILLLDEATSALDSVTERRIQSSLEYLMRGKTVAVIAHRLSTIAHMDRILVFHNGQIVEDGGHDELLRADGHYARMWRMQAGGFLPEHESAPDTLERLAS